MKRIAITGANGFVASVIKMYNRDRFEFIDITRREIDLTKPETVAPFLEGIEYDVLIHTAANAVTEFCAEHPDIAHAINVESAIEAAKVTQAKNARFVFLSTEQIYNGRTDEGPFTEEDEPLCVTTYGNSKLETEAFLNGNIENRLILRLSTMFGLPMPGIRPSANAMTKAWNAMRTGTPAKFTPHEKRGMTYIMHLADHLEKLLELPSGTYHVSSANTMTTYESARYVARQLGYAEAQIDRCILPDEERYAERPRDYRLNGAKLAELGIDLGTVEADIDRCLSDFGLR